MYKNIEDKVIVVSGSSGLIGREVVKLLVQNKATVIELDIITSENNKSHFICCDITDNQQVEKSLSTILQRFNKIDGLVNLAYPRTSDWGKLEFEDIPFESWQMNIDIQLDSTFFICQQVIKIMRKQKSGSIVNIGSIYGVVGNDFSMYEGTKGTSGIYAAIKGGVINLTRYLASFYGQYNVRVNCISPGGVLDAAKQSQEFIQNYSEKSPMKRLGDPIEIAEPIAFLLSDGAAYITGQNLMVDGGWTAI
jgi:NAD(P)-dependent dehydrogenase (short-subunit alcohol dehydrogenase family)